MSDLAISNLSLPTSPLQWSDGSNFNGLVALVLTYDPENPPSRQSIPVPPKAVFPIVDGALQFPAKMPWTNTYDAPVRHFAFYATSQRELLTAALPTGGFDITSAETTLPAPAAPLVKPILPADPTGVTL